MQYASEGQEFAAKVADAIEANIDRFDNTRLTDKEGNPTSVLGWTAYLKYEEDKETGNTEWDAETFVDRSTGVWDEAEAALELTPTQGNRAFGSDPYFSARNPATGLEAIPMLRRYAHEGEVKWPARDG